MDEQFYQFEVESAGVSQVQDGAFSLTERGIVRALNYANATEQIEDHYGRDLLKLSLFRISDGDILFISSTVAQDLESSHY